MVLEVGAGGGGYENAGFWPPLVHPPRGALDRRLDLRRFHIADDGDERTAWSEVLPVKSDDVVSCDRLDRRLGHDSTVGVTVAVHHARKDSGRD
jgi:hypothetical protein